MIITALSAPLLIAATGLAVDISYFYQEQVALQAAADAAAIAVSKAASAYGVSTTSTLTPTTFATTGAGPYFAKAAANYATNNSYNFALSGNNTITVSAANPSGSILSWKATAQAPRASFFSPVRGLGLTGLGAGFQAAGATAEYVPGSSSTCLNASTLVVASGTNGVIEGTNCALFSGSQTATCPFSEISNIVDAANSPTTLNATGGEGIIDGIGGVFISSANTTSTEANTGDTSCIQASNQGTGQYIGTSYVRSTDSGTRTEEKITKASTPSDYLNSISSTLATNLVKLCRHRQHGRHRADRTVGDNRRHGRDGFGNACSANNRGQHDRIFL
jgi:hypothetical protein